MWVIIPIRMGIGILALGVVCVTCSVQAQQPKAPTAAQTVSPAEALKRWKQLTKRRDEISERLAELEKQFEKAKREEQLQIRDEFQQLIGEYEQKVYPGLVSVADVVYQQQPDNLEAAEFVVESAFRSNQYVKAASIADSLIEAGVQSPTIWNYAGAANFAIHNFEHAHDTLSEAAEAEELDPSIGGRYLNDSLAYVDFWNKEQEIRAAEATATGEAALPRVLLKTTRGDVLIELFENEAPNTVANFISLVESKRYDGTAFHRVIPNFMVQGGDPNSLDADPNNDGMGGPGYTIKCECYKPEARKHFRGSLSMAHAGKDSGGSQFFITHLPTPHLNPNSERMTGHTVFGRVIGGMEAVDATQRGDRILKADVVRKRNHPYQPITTPEK